ncbi:MAG: hypothetical protein D6767_08345 [Candidatus Hydrogenedentota bacterium]|nr:MAG: hypothetical protein D6767_08345 [Candidatus Hydrogenedentota bacterium]
MSEAINKAINLGIGVAIAVKEGLENTAASLQEEINALIAKGETVDSETAVKTRELADKATEYLNELQAKAAEATEQVKAQIEPLIEEAKKYVEELRAKLEGEKQEETSSQTATQQNA